MDSGARALAGLGRSKTGITRRFSAEQRLDLAETASGIGTFEYDLARARWDLSPQTARLFGFVPDRAPEGFAEWERVIFPDDAVKLLNQPLVTAGTPEPAAVPAHPSAGKRK